MNFDKEDATVVQVRLLESSEDYTRIILKNKVLNAKLIIRYSVISCFLIIVLSSCATKFEKQFTVVTLDKIYLFEDRKMNNYLFISKKDEKFYKIVNASIRKEKINFSFTSENNIFAEKIIIQLQILN